MMFWRKIISGRENSKSEGNQVGAYEVYIGCKLIITMKHV